MVTASSLNFASTVVIGTRQSNEVGRPLAIALNCFASRELHRTPNCFAGLSRVKRRVSGPEGGQ